MPLCLFREAKIIKELAVYLGILKLQWMMEYSGGQKKRYEYCFIKQKCHFQMGLALCKNAATPLRIIAINITHQHFQMRYITLFQLKELKCY